MTKNLYITGGLRTAHYFSYAGGDECSSDDVLGVIHELKGWREVLLPLSSVLRWDKPYHPVIIVGTTTFFFSFVWYTEMSTLTSVSLTFMLLGILDFIVPLIGPTVTGIKTWTDVEESVFIEICEAVASFHGDVKDTWRGLKTMRHQNAKLFFFIVVGVFVISAWIGSMINNLLLTYLFVTCALLVPGVQEHEVIHKYMQFWTKVFTKFKMAVSKKMN